MRDGSRQRPWSIRTSECRDPAEIGDLRRSLTWQDVMSAHATRRVPAGEVTAPRYTLVNLDTTFSTEPHTFTRTLSIIGYTVDVEVTPTTYTWHWGDGRRPRPPTPGRPYPSTDITHTYLHHATHRRARRHLSVDVELHSPIPRRRQAAWIEFPDTLTINGPAVALPIKQASAVLVDPQPADL